MSNIRPGTRHERKNGEYWREVCTCGWIGRQWKSHLAMVHRMAPFGQFREIRKGHRLERYGWYKDEEATKQ